MNHHEERAELQGFERHALPAGGQSFLTGKLPPKLIFGAEAFRELLHLRPAEPHRIQMAGKWIRVPRGQQAYDRDYRFSGTVNPAKPLPEVLRPFERWREAFFRGFRGEVGTLVNWYSGRFEYLGRHRDSRAGLVPGAPIVTVTLGETRALRFRRFQQESVRLDIHPESRDVLVIPWETNLHWKHEVLKSARYMGERISLTFRLFECSPRSADADPNCRSSSVCEDATHGPAISSNGSPNP